MSHRQTEKGDTDALDALIGANLQHDEIMRRTRSDRAIGQRLNGGETDDLGGDVGDFHGRLSCVGVGACIGEIIFFAHAGCW